MIVSGCGRRSAIAADAIVILDAFQKKTAAAPKRVIGDFRSIAVVTLRRDKAPAIRAIS
jgi:hypothetical protein